MNPNFKSTVDWIGAPSRANPCKKDCPDRSATCHTECERYMEYKALLEKQRKEHLAELDYYDVRAQNRKRCTRYSTTLRCYVKR